MPKKIPNKCPECGSNNVKYNKKTKELLCNDCGLIIYIE